MVWADQAVRFKLTAEAHRKADWRDLEFEARRLTIVAHLHLDALGHQYLILKGTTVQVVLHISGPLVTTGPVHIRLLIDGLTTLEEAVTQLSALSHLVHGSRSSLVIDRPGRVETTKLRDALIAIDGEQAGATRREIATVIYGAGRVAEEWAHPSGRLKAVIKRDVQRGRRLVAGGYRRLVAGETSRAIA